MPRTNDISKLRRIAMQVVMWIILAGTVGLAALVNAHVTRTRNAMSEPLILGGTVRIQLPKSWLGAEDDDSLIEARESGDETARQLRVKLGSPSSLIDSIRALTDAGAMEGSTQNLKIRIADQDGTLVVRKIPVEPGFYYVEVTAAALLPPGNRKLTILLRGFNSGQKSEVQNEIDLVKRVAATVRIGEKPE